MGDLTGTGNSNERPVRTLELSDYYMSAAEVTQQQWYAVMKDRPSKFSGGDLPVETIRWDEALAFCEKLNDIERRTGRLPKGYIYTLPTEAQWEKACRAGTEGDYAGNLDLMAWHMTNSRYKTNPVATRAPNPWGFYDMHGNVWEWCRDFYQDSLEELASKDPSGPRTGTRRVIRGGSWDSSTTENLRSACRSTSDPAGRSDDLGMRVVLTREESFENSLPADTAKTDAETFSKSFTNGISQQMIWVPPGTFRMGDLTGTGNSNEYPVRTVELSGYHLSATEVTQRQWKTIIGNNPSKYQDDNLPVEQVSWTDAMEFCEKLTALEKEAGRLPPNTKYFLPTEAQWENACRAGSESILPQDLPEIAWYDVNSWNRTNPVAAKHPNQWGFYDLRGNVSEWCFDYYRDSYAGLSTRDPQGPDETKYRAVRGGSWGSAVEQILRPSFRSAGYPSGRIANAGFRVALIQTNGIEQMAASAAKGAAAATTRTFEKNATFINGIEQQMIWVFGGSFRMGDLMGNGNKNEYPIRTVELSGYHLSATEVTQNQWQEITGNNPSYFKGKTHPVEKISWDEAMEFCKLLTYFERKAGRLPVGYVYSLPSEAQWEYACRAGTEGDYAGDIEAMAWHETNSDGSSHPVATKQPNAWNFHDMHGNVSEWCRDVYQDSYEGLNQRDPVAVDRGRHPVVRGGSWASTTHHSLRSAYRMVDPPSYRHTIGFRVVLIRKENAR